MWELYKANRSRWIFENKADKRRHTTGSQRNIGSRKLKLRWKKEQIKKSWKMEGKGELVDLENPKVVEVVLVISDGVVVVCGWWCHW